MPIASVDLAPHAADRSATYVWYVVVLLTIVNVLNYVDRMALAVMLPSIKADLQLSDGQLGLLVGLAFSLFYAICGIPIARWADRSVRKNIIALALATWSLMTALSGAAQNFWHLLVARVGVGVGEAGCLPPAQSLICDYVPQQRRPGYFAVHAFGGSCGVMLGMALAGSLAESVGWRWAFVILGLPGIAIAAVVALTLREPKRGFFETREPVAAQRALGESLRELSRCRTYRWLVLFLVANGFVQYGVNQWLPSFYTRVFGLSLSMAGIHVGLAIGLGSASGLLIGGVLANRAARFDARLPFTVSAVATLLALPTALCSLMAASARTSIWLMALTAVLWTVSNAAVVAAKYSVVPASMRATGGALGIFGTAVVGAGLGPLSVGLLSDLLTPSLATQALRYALVGPLCLVPLMSFALYAASKSVSGDLRAIGPRA